MSSVKHKFRSESIRFAYMFKQSCVINYGAVDAGR